jgi:Phosphatidylinositol N-acetylglucosaminyltransferase
MTMTSHYPGYFSVSLLRTICTMIRFVAAHQRRLWRPLDESTCLSQSTSSASLSNGDNNGCHERERETALETYETLRSQFVVAPPVSCSSTSTTAAQLAPYWRSWPRLCANAVVVVQEFALSSWLLARHRLVQEEIQYSEFLVSASTWLLLIAMGITIAYSMAVESASANGSNALQQSRCAKARQRAFDALLVAVLLRFTAQVLPSLTASYSTDTVERMAGLGLLVHLLFCDYSYANGRPPSCAPPRSPTLSSMAPHEDTTSTVARYQSRRPSFQGGTASLNAVFSHDALGEHSQVPSSILVL